jgi:hypothetical protein
MKKDEGTEVIWGAGLEERRGKGLKKKKRRTRRWDGNVIPMSGSRRKREEEGA